MTTPCKISVTALVVVGAKEIISTGKMHDETTDVKSVINPAMDKAAAEAERNLCFVKAEVYASAEAMDRRGTVLENADLADMTVKDLRDHFGRFIKVHAEYAEVESGAATSLPSGLETLMRTQQQRSRALPTPPSGGRYEFRLFRALLVKLEDTQLSFPLLDADQSGKSMLTALSHVLQYVLPFDDAEPSPLRAAGRVHLKVPARFKTRSLDNETLSAEHHGEKKTEAHAPRRPPRSLPPWRRATPCTARCASTAALVQPAPSRFRTGAPLGCQAARSRRATRRLRGLCALGKDGALAALHD